MATNPFNQREAVRRPVAVPDEMEDGLRALARQEFNAAPVLNNADNMEQAQRIIDNTLTAAHGDTIKVLHSMRAECHQLVERVDKLVDEHEALLRKKGQTVAVVIEAAMQELKRSVAWLEEQTPRLVDPKLELPALPKPGAEQAAS
jgi:hypothetical protein